MSETSLTPYLRSRRQDPREQLAMMMMQQHARPVSTIGQGVSSLANMIAGGMAGQSIRRGRAESASKSLAGLIASNTLSPKVKALAEQAVKSGDEDEIQDAKHVVLADMLKTPSYSHLKSVPGVGLVDMRTNEVIIPSGETAAAGRIATDVEGARRRIKEFAQSTPPGKTPLEYIKTVIEAPLGSLTPKDQIVADDIRRAYDAARAKDQDLPEFEALLNRKVPPTANPAGVSAGEDSRLPAANESGIVDWFKSLFPGNAAPTPPPVKIQPTIPPVSNVAPGPAMPSVSELPSGIETNVGSAPSVGERFMAALTPEGRALFDRVRGLDPKEVVRDLGRMVGIGRGEAIGAVPTEGAPPEFSPRPTGSMDLGAPLVEPVAPAVERTPPAGSLSDEMGPTALDISGFDRPGWRPASKGGPAWIVPRPMTPAGGEGGMRGMSPARIGEREEAPEPTQAERDIIEWAPGMKPADLIPGKTYRRDGIKRRWLGTRFSDPVT